MKELQSKLDLQKWFDSEEAGRDRCGEYGYCAYCDNTTQTPCADAYAVWQDKTVKKEEAPKAKATTKAKAAPKAKAEPKAKAAPKAKAEPKAKAAPKAKAEPKAKTTKK